MQIILVQCEYRTKVPTGINYPEPFPIEVYCDAEEKEVWNKEIEKYLCYSGLVTKYKKHFKQRFDSFTETVNNIHHAAV